MHSIRRLVRIPRAIKTLAPLALTIASCTSTPPADSGVADIVATDAVDTVTEDNVVQCEFDAGVITPVPTPPIHTPRWAFEPWISKDISTAADTYAFVDGFRERDIPVGVVVLDSPWETQYNTFVPSPTRYPNFARMVSDMHDRSVRVVLWVTQMINRSSFDAEIGGDTYIGPSPNYAQARACNFLVDRAADYQWWKGRGGGLDFFEPRATEWWHRQQDPLFDMGIDGWKLDFGESYVTSDPVQTAAGPVPHQRYSEEYYRDFLAYGVSRRGRENFVTMVRPYDESYNFAGRFFARKEHAPVSWVGDNRRDDIGLADALDHMFRSAQAGYVVIGSDIGGYLDRNDRALLELVPFSQDNFARWTAVGALTPFMQLHGRANLAPWTIAERTTETVALYRYWSKLHHEMVPFYYSLAEQAYAGGPTIMLPVGATADWPNDYRYQLGRAFLVAPMLDSSGHRDVALPAGDRWYEWWNPALPAHVGGTTLLAYDATNQLHIPLFVREGAIVPLSVSDAVTGLGTVASTGRLTALIYPASTVNSFTVHDEDGATTRIEAARTAMETTVMLSRAPRGAVLRVRVEAAVASVSLAGRSLTVQPSRDALDAASEGWFMDAANHFVWVRLAPGPAAQLVAIR